MSSTHITIETATLKRAAAHLIMLSRELARTTENTPQVDKRRNKVWAITEARFRGALSMAAVLGLGATETDVYWKVRNAEERAGDTWRGRAGALIDPVWLDTAVSHLTDSLG